MKILISIPWFTPAYKAGGPIRSVANLVKKLNQSFNINIFTSNLDLLDTQPLVNIKSNQWLPFSNKTQVWYQHAKNKYLQSIRFFKKESADILFINGIYSPHFTLIPIIFSPIKRKIVSVRGMLHPQALDQKKWKKSFYLLFFKSLTKLKNLEFHATDDTEADFIKKSLGNHTKIHIAPNFPTEFSNTSILKNINELHLITVALIGPMKNHLLVLEALKKFSSHHRITFHICGPVYFDAYWQQCIETIELLPDNIKVIYHGSLPPNELEVLYQKAHVFICPSQSENFGHAFFESLSCGRPIISSYNTPWLNLKEKQAGLNVQLDDHDILDSISFFASMNQADYNQWTIGAKRYAEDYLGKQLTFSQYLNMFGNNSEQ